MKYVHSTDGAIHTKVESLALWLRYEVTKRDKLDVIKSDVFEDVTDCIQEEVHYQHRTMCHTKRTEFYDFSK